MRYILTLAAGLAALPLVRAAEPFAEPKPVPLTRPEVKQALEALKTRTPRLPLPDPAEGEQSVNNARMRQKYLPEGLRDGGFSRTPEPKMTVDPTFKVMLFWIASRVNNCQYCLGHQEIKLTNAGVAEDRIAALDGDWSEFSPAEQAALAFTRKLTFEPHRITDADMAELGKHYKPEQVLEIVLTVAGYNMTNRWTDSLGIPQEKTGDRLSTATGVKKEYPTFLTPTSDAFKTKTTKVAPTEGDKPAPAAVARRGNLEDREAVLMALEACKKRKPRLPLADEKSAAELLPEGTKLDGTPQWVRALAVFPVAGKGRIASTLAARTKGTLSEKLVARIAWVCAREDRAWYAVGDARRRLKALGESDDAVFALDGDGAGLPEKERAALTFARKLTNAPSRIADADIEGLRKHFPDGQVAEIVYQTTVAAFFDRLTEAAGLSLED
jgi:alkylhydroperoxidase family enzyme